MGRFKNKEEYFQWAQKRKRRLLFIAAVKKALLNKWKSFFEKKIYLKKSFLFPISSILVAGLIISIYSTHSEKKETRIQEKFDPNGKAVLPGSNPSFVPAKPRNRQPENFSLTMEDIIQKAQKTVVLIKSPDGGGSGFLLPHPGLIVTSSHLLGRSNEAEVLIPSGASKSAVVLKRFTMPVNVAFLQVEDLDLVGLPFADSDRCQEGEEIVAAGSPGGDKWRADLVLTKGKILSCHQSYQGIQYLQIDRAIHPANIGGPIINTKGEVIGLSKGELVGKGFEGLQYGLAINVVKALLDQKPSQLEERVKERENFFKYVYDDLWVILSQEYQLYQKRLYDLHLKGVLSAEEATRLEKRPFHPPSGYSSLKGWVADLTEKVINREITKEKAVALVKAHFEL
jgi:S1-C subfamily serine protease